MSDKYEWYKAGGFMQGDVLIEIINKIPEGSRLVEPEDGHNIVAHSETGHHHVIPAEDSMQYSANDDEFVSYVEIKNDSKIIHLRSFDTHKTRYFKAGTMLRIRKQTQETHEGFVRVVD